MRSHRLIARVVLATLISAALLGLATGCGDDDSGGDTTEASTTSSSTSTASTSEEDSGRDGRGSRPSGNRGGAEEDDDGNRPGIFEQDEPEDQSPEGRFTAELRSIVGQGITSLLPIASPAAATGDPDAYAGLLRKASTGLETTITSLEELDAPADAEEGVGQITAAFTDLRGAIDAGADRIESGESQAAVAELQDAGIAFRGAIADATGTLDAAGYETPSLPGVR